MSARHRILIGSLVLAGIFTLARLGAAEVLDGQVIDSATGKPIAGATVTVGDEIASTGATGQFAINSHGAKIMARAPGYRAVMTITADRDGPTLIRLAPFAPKALYLSFYGIGSRAIREAALKTIHESHDLNAVVIDVKGDRGLVAFKTQVPLAQMAGAARITTLPDLPGLIKELRGQGLYTIARIVVFKDDPLGNARPDLAVKSADGRIFHDREGLSWTDPFRHEVWDYNLALAVEAAAAGFDEIQFDYVRFPDAKDLQFSQQVTRNSRVAAITGFLTEAQHKLISYNVFVSVDVFGYVCWNLDDTGIGQQLEDIVPLVDYVSPMLYPSGFSFGIPGYADPMLHPREIVQFSLARAVARTHVSPLRFRPWLQAFKDYAFDHRDFDAGEVKTQIEAAEGGGTDGWMLWNPRNDYAELGF